MKLRLSRRARDDLIEIGAYLRARNPTAAVRVRAAIESAFDLLQHHPQAGRVRRHRVRCLSLPRFPYLIFYRFDLEADEIVVLTVRHGARKPIA